MVCPSEGARGVFRVVYMKWITVICSVTVRWPVMDFISMFRRSNEGSNKFK